MCLLQRTVNERQWILLRLKTKDRKGLRERKQVPMHMRPHPHKKKTKKRGVYVDKHTALPIPM